LSIDGRVRLDTLDQSLAGVLMLRAKGISTNPGFRSLCTAGQERHLRIVALAEDFLAKPKFILVFQPCSTSVLAGNQTGQVAGSDVVSQGAETSANDVKGASIYG